MPFSLRLIVEAALCRYEPAVRSARKGLCLLLEAGPEIELSALGATDWEYLLSLCNDGVKDEPWAQLFLQEYRTKVLSDDGQQKTSRSNFQNPSHGDLADSGVSNLSAGSAGNDFELGLQNPSNGKMAYSGKIPPGFSRLPSQGKLPVVVKKLPPGFGTLVDLKRMNQATAPRTPPIQDSELLLEQRTARIRMDSFIREFLAELSTSDRA